MRKRAMLLCLLSACLLPGVAMNGGEPVLMKLSLQMMVVTTPDWNATTGTLRRYERTRANKPWDLVGEPIPVVVGKGGLGWGDGAISLDPSYKASDDPVKKEGDGRAPAGVFRLGTSFGYADQREQDWKMSYTSLTPNIECVDDTNSKYYNRVVDNTKVTPDWKSSEHMRRDDDDYRWGLVVEHNHSNKPGEGSCIFMHIWEGPDQPTVGCTAMPQAQLETVLAWLDPHKLPVLLQVPQGIYDKLQPDWKLQ